MGVGLHLSGYFDTTKNSSAEDWLAQIASWVEDDVAADEDWGNLYSRCRLGQSDEGTAALHLSFHVGAEDFALEATDEGHVQVSVKTSTLGPGYHIFLCDFFHRLGREHGVTWDPPGEDGCEDDTEYFFTGNATEVEQAMLEHLKVVAALTLELVDKEEYQSISWAMPLSPRFEDFGPVRTVLGPRDLEWVKAVHDDPRHGIDCMPWWDEGFGASMKLGRALCEMWLSMRWRAPITDAEEELLDTVTMDLATAYRDDPSLNYPWREWAELLDYLEESEELEPLVLTRAAEDGDGPRIGYRRGTVRVDLADGWQITLPGAMTEEWRDDLWTAWDGERTIWFNWYHLEAKDGSAPPAEKLLEAMKLPEGERLDYRGTNVIGGAVIQPHEEDGQRLWNLCARSAIAGRAALCNIYYQAETDRAWAIEVWHSLDRVPDSEAKSSEDG